MTVAPTGVALVMFALGYTLSSPESSGTGHRLESDSFTAPTVIARCITQNINKNKPELAVRNRTSDTSDGSIYLVLNTKDQTPTTFGVIRIDQSATGSHLTTWLPSKSVPAYPDRWLSGTNADQVTPEEVSRNLIAGC